MSVWEFSEFLPPIDPAHRLSIGEGNTPLVKSRRIGPSAGIDNLYLKLENTNPTGSYKDRFASVAISNMLATNRSRCIGTSSGNSGAALAAYCAVAGLECEIAIVEKAPAGKLLQMLAYGATLRRVRGFGIDPDITERTLAKLALRGNQPDCALQITAYYYCPIGMQGVQTISHELHAFAASNDVAIEHVFVPAGGGGLALAIARGFEQRKTRRQRSTFPAVHVVQPVGNDTIATPLRTGANTARQVTCTTEITGLQVPTVIDGNDVIYACRETAGLGHTVSDVDVWTVQSRLAAEEGVFCEPAGAVALCGALAAAERGDIRRAATIVCIVTGSGFKDTSSIERMVRERQCPTVDISEL